MKAAAWQSANGGTGNLGTALCALRRRARRLNRPQRAQQYHLAVGGGDLGGRIDSQGRNTRGGTIAQFNLGMMLTVEGDSSGHDFGYSLHTKSCGTWILPRLRKKLGNKHDVVMAVCGVLLTLKGNSEKKSRGTRRFGGPMRATWTRFDYRALDRSRPRDGGNMDIEARCAAPPEALAHSPSQMPLSCPVAPPSQRELQRRRRRRWWRGEENRAARIPKTRSCATSSAVSCATSFRAGGGVAGGGSNVPSS